MNSASMRFIPADKLVEEGYAEYAKLFEKPAGKR
jgi:peptide methionine sulfoxide reductase msrA/msrB